MVKPTTTHTASLLRPRFFFSPRGVLRVGCVFQHPRVVWCEPWNLVNGEKSIVHHREEVLKKDPYSSQPTDPNEELWRLLDEFLQTVALFEMMCAMFSLCLPAPEVEHRQVSFPIGHQSSNHSFSGAILNRGVCLGIFLPNLWFVSVSRSVGFFKRVRDVCERWRENQLEFVGRVFPMFHFQKKRCAVCCKSRFCVLIVFILNFCSDWFVVSGRTSIL